MKGTRAADFRANPKSIIKKITELRDALAEKRVEQQTGQSRDADLREIRTIRKAIARALTVFHETERARARQGYRGAKFLPTDLRIKKTRAKRRALTQRQANKRTVRAHKKAINFPVRKYALRA